MSVFGLSELAQAVFMKATVTEGTITYSSTELSTFGELIVAFAGIRSCVAVSAAGLSTLSHHSGARNR